MSTLKVDTVRPVTTDGSLSLKGDSGGSATTNGISVDSSGNTSVSGSASLDGAVTINESGADVDFRVESDTVDHALFVQGSDGYVGIGVSSPADKLHVDGNIRLTAGSGVNFSAYATSGNPSSNLLDDYEEGTWSPAINSGTFTGGTAQYTKVGRCVTICLVEASNFSDTSSSTEIEIGGLPFTPITPSRSTGAAFGERLNKNAVVATLQGGVVKFTPGFGVSTFDFLKFSDINDGVDVSIAFTLTYFTS